MNPRRWHIPDPPRLTAFLLSLVGVTGAVFAVALLPPRTILWTWTLASAIGIIISALALRVAAEDWRAVRTNKERDAEALKIAAWMAVRRASTHFCLPIFFFGVGLIALARYPGGTRAVVASAYVAVAALLIVSELFALRDEGRLRKTLMSIRRTR
jgi:hypothetical protein